MPNERLPIGKARIVRPGRDLTHRDLQRDGARSARGREGVQRRGIRNRSCRSSHGETARHRTVLASVARTGRLLCVGEAFPWGGVTAEVIARVTTEGFHLLDAAPARINAKDTPIPYHPNLWSEHRPNRKTIAAKARQILAEIIFMPQVPITMPQLGESMAEATIVSIKVKPGDKVSADQEIIEVETDKAVMGVTTPCAGRDREDRCGSERHLRRRRGARLRRSERSRRGAIPKTRAAQPKGEVAKEIPGRQEEDSESGRQRKRLAFSSGRRRSAASRDRHSKSVNAAVCPFPRAQKAPDIFRRGCARAWRNCN